MHAFFTHSMITRASSSSIWYTAATNAAVTPPGRVSISASSSDSDASERSPLRLMTCSKRSRSCSMPVCAACSTRSSNVSAATRSASRRCACSSARVSASTSAVILASASSGAAAACSSGASSASRSASASAQCRSARWQRYRRHSAFALRRSTLIASLRSTIARRQNSLLMSACPRLLCSTERARSTTSTSCCATATLRRQSASITCPIASRPRCHALSASESLPAL
mmetsp:Transcript_48249/g.127374  ORF Transcript_48249/g.127374 Transcript_48249/m.127374 type:complete len:228 (-) Transcript_48249:127-810(-)